MLHTYFMTFRDMKIEKAKFKDKSPFLQKCLKKRNLMLVYFYKCQYKDSYRKIQHIALFLAVSSAFRSCMT